MLRVKLTLLFLSLLTTSTRGEVLTQSFIVRLSEMKQVIEGQKSIIEESSLKTIVDEKQRIIKNLTNVIEDQKQVIENQKEMMKNQTKIISELTDNATAVSARLQPPNVYFRVILWKEDVEVSPGSIIPWEEVNDNIGDGYKTENNSFFAPINGIYQLGITVVNPEYSNSYLAYMALMTENNTLCRAVSAENDYETGTCSRVVQLTDGERVWVENPVDGGDGYYYGRGYTSFSGVLLRV